MYTAKLCLSAWVLGRKTKHTPCSWFQITTHYWWRGLIFFLPECNFLIKSTSSTERLLHNLNSHIGQSSFFFIIVGWSVCIYFSNNVRNNFRYHLGIIFILNNVVNRFMGVQKTLYLQWRHTGHESIHLSYLQNQKKYSTVSIKQLGTGARQSQGKDDLIHQTPQLIRELGSFPMAAFTN